MDEQQPPVLASASPAAATKRDALGSVCFYLHLAVMIFILTGWLLIWRTPLIVYLAFLPAVAVQWQFNKNSCVLNNIESYLRNRTWRDPNNKEEGAWLQNLLHDATGILFKPWHMDALTYVILIVLWGAGFWHLSRT